jgi:hypothetical protein
LRLWHEIMHRSSYRYTPLRMQAMLDSDDPREEADLIFLEESTIFRTEQEAEAWKR